jgi:hypothetical protein
MQSSQGLQVLQRRLEFFQSNPDALINMFAYKPNPNAHDSTTNQPPPPIIESDLYVHDMDMDAPFSYDTLMNTSFVSQAKSLSQNAIATSQHPQPISIESQQEMMHSDWSVNRHCLIMHQRLNDA